MFDGGKIVKRSLKLDFSSNSNETRAVDVVDVVELKLSLGHLGRPSSSVKFVFGHWRCESIRTAISC